MKKYNGNDTDTDISQYNNKVITMEMIRALIITTVTRKNDNGDKKDQSIGIMILIITE